MKEFEEFLVKMESPEQRERLEEILHWVQDNFPQLERRIAWNQPMFTDHGTFIIGFSVSKKHLAVAPEGVERFSRAAEEAGYDCTKMLIRIPWNKAVSFSLLEEIISFNIADKKDCETFWRK